MINIHLGLHKTGTTFLQKAFFPKYAKQSGFLCLRSHGADFLDYLIYSSEVNFNHNYAIQLYNDALNKAGLVNAKNITICDEILCGVPWNNSSDRFRIFDRLNLIFKNEAKYSFTVRRQEDLVLSLYYEYIKKGGSASVTDFFSYRRLALNISRGDYFNFGGYYTYIAKHVNPSNIQVFCYEELKDQPLVFFNKLSDHMDFKLNGSEKLLVGIKENKSIKGLNARLLRFINKFCKSERQPFLLLPGILQKISLKLLLTLPQFNTKNESSVAFEFSKSLKSNNHFLPNYDHLKEYGY